MILNGHEDLRIQKTMEGIYSAFDSLICEKDYAKITVTELCQRARINKKTFYNYYPTLDDLLLEMQVCYSKGYIERVKDYHLPEDLDKVNREFFLYSAEQGLAYEKITCSGSYVPVRDTMIDQVNAETWDKSKEYMRLKTEYRNQLLEYVRTVSLTTYRQWVADGKKIPLENMINISNSLLCNGTQGFLKCIQKEEKK